MWVLREKERQVKNARQHRMIQQNKAEEAAHVQAGRDYSEPNTQHPARSCRRVVTTSRR